jgi:hypothetical protein
MTEISCQANGDYIYAIHSNVGNDKDNNMYKKLLMKSLSF